MKIKCIFFLFLLLLVTPSSHAADNKISKTVLMFGGLEGMLITHSWLLTKFPVGYGIASGVIYPLVGIESGVSGAYVTTVLTAEGMNIYNLKMGEKNYSEGEVFRRNIIGWHVVFGVMVASNMLLGKQSKSVKSNAFNFVPTEYGGELRFEMKF